MLQVDTDVALEMVRHPELVKDAVSQGKMVIHENGAFQVSETQTEAPRASPSPVS